MAPFAAAGASLVALITGQPIIAGAAAAGAIGLGAMRLGVHFVDTSTGMRLIRQGLNNSYAPSVVGRTLQSLGALAEEEPSSEPQVGTQSQTQSQAQTPTTVGVQ